MVFVMDNNTKDTPAASQAPLETELFGCMKGRIKVVGDILEPLDEVWEALSL